MGQGVPWENIQAYIYIYIYIYYAYCDKKLLLMSLKRISVRYSGDAYSLQCGMQSLIWGG